MDARCSHLFQIMDRRQLNDSVVLQVLKAPLIAAKTRAGQFVMVRPNQRGERIPLTVADHDRDAGTITIIFQVVGGTTRIMADLGRGDFLEDVTGPLGVPTHYGDAKRICVVGGGVGCAIAYPQAKALHGAGAAVDVIAGFRSKELVILEEEMRAASRHYFLTTDDGSYGEKGFVTDKLRARIDAGAGYELVIAIGPVPMMKFVSRLTAEYGVKTLVSLNPIMIDGTGMCGCCRVTVGGQTRFACVDGPDFDGHQVDFDELMSRNTSFQAEEADHICRLEGAR